MAGPNKPRCVFDCVVLLQGAISRGPAFVLLTLVEAGRLELLLCSAIVSEVRDVLLRTEVQRRFPILSVEFVDAFLGRLQRIAMWIEPVPACFRFPRDPDDEAYLDLAVHGGAQYLVTRDRDLLDLAGSASDEAERLRQICPGLRILDPVDLLRALASKPD